MEWIGEAKLFFFFALLSLRLVKSNCLDNLSHGSNLPPPHPLLRCTYTHSVHKVITSLPGNKQEAWCYGSFKLQLLPSGKERRGSKEPIILTGGPMKMDSVSKLQLTMKSKHPGDGRWWHH